MRSSVLRKSLLQEAESQASAPAPATDSEKLKTRVSELKGHRHFRLALAFHCTEDLGTTQLTKAGF